MSKIVDGIVKDVSSIPKKIKSNFKKVGPKQYIIMLLPYILIAYFTNKFCYFWRISAGGGFGEKLTNFLNAVNNNLFKNPLPSFHPKDILYGVIGAIVLRLVVYYKSKNAKKYRHGEEYGSARWGTPKDAEPYMDAENEENNIILTETERLRLTGRFPAPKYERNKNVLVIGGSGSGKTRFFIKPNLMQLHSSYVVTDPKGTVVLECGKMFQKAGYKVKIFNTINFDRSMKYNPFVYIKDEKDILKFITTLMANTEGEGAQSGEDFWKKAERLLYIAYISFMFEYMPPEERTFETLLWMINVSETREDDETYKNLMDEKFDEIEQYDPDAFCLKQYKYYKLAAGKTAKSILISCAARLAVFDIKQIKDMTSEDEMELDMLGDEKTVLFIIISDTDSTFNFLVSIMYSQLFNLLCDRADNVYNGKLPVHVRCLCDEFANIGKIPMFEKLITTIRSREISACIILQTKSQLKAIYKDNADTIEGNCDTSIFLGGREKTTLKDLSEELGKETIDMYNTSDTRGNSPSYGTNFQKTGHDLMAVNELAIMDRGECICTIGGVRPFKSKKFDITKHKRYVELSDYDEKNRFNVEEYVKNPVHLKITKSTEVDIAVDLGEVG